MCWVHLSSSGHSLCRLDGRWPGCSSHPISGISSCKIIRTVKSKWLTLHLDHCTPATHPWSHPTGSSREKSGQSRTERAPVFTQTAYFGNKQTKRPVNVIDPNSVSDNFQEVTLFCFYVKVIHHGCEWGSEWALRLINCEWIRWTVKQQSYLIQIVVVFFFFFLFRVDCSTFVKHLFLIPQMVPFSSGG